MRWLVAAASFLIVVWALGRANEILMIQQAAAYEPTATEKSACMPEAFKFCLGHALIGDREGVIACLIVNKPKLAKPCRDVLTAHGL